MSVLLNMKASKYSIKHRDTRELEIMNNVKYVQKSKKA